MKFTHVTQIGCGGTGGLLAPQLARLSRYHPRIGKRIHLVDGDDFEEHNRDRQACGDTDIGTSKAAAVKRLCAMQGLDVSCEKRYVDAGWLVTRFSKGRTHLVVAAVDNDATRRLIINALRIGPDFLYISPANADDESGDAPIRGFVNWWGRIGGRTWGMDPTLLYPNLAQPTDYAPRAGSCTSHAPSSPQLLAANAMAAATTMAVLQNILDDRMPAERHGLFFDARPESFSHRLV